MIPATELGRYTRIRAVSGSIIHHEQPNRRAAMRRSASVPASVNQVDILPVAPAADRAATWSGDGPPRFIQQLAAESGEIDAELYLFALCRHLQMISLERLGIECILDSEGTGRLPKTVCRMLGLMVCELVNDASECRYPKTAREAVKVTLRRRGTTCICTISRRCAASCACAKHGLRRARQLASELGDSCMVQAMPQRGITAIMFDIALVEQCFAAPTRPNRTEEASQRDERLSAVVPDEVACPTGPHF